MGSGSIAVGLEGGLSKRFWGGEEVDERLRSKGYGKEKRGKEESGKKKTSNVSLREE